MHLVKKRKTERIKEGIKQPDSKIEKISQKNVFCAIELGVGIVPGGAEAKRGGKGKFILALKHESRIVRYCRDLFKVSTVFLTGLWASPHPLFSVHSSNTVLKMRNKKYAFLIHPSNI